MRQLCIFWLCSLSIGLWAQQNKDCRVGSLFSEYNGILPIEKIYVHSDQSYYEPGETIWFKVYALNEQLKAQGISDQVRAELISPVGNKVAEIRLSVANGSCHGDFALTADAAGGIYKLRVYTIWQKNFGESLFFEKDLTVQRYMLPNLLMTLDFLRESYGPGAEVVAKLELRSKDNQPLANKKFDYTVELGGKKHSAGSLSTAADGKALVIFQLPASLATADGLLNIQVEHDGRKESISRSIPIVTRNISMQLLPEGGDLIEGFRSRVGFKALDEFGKPVDFNGRLVNQSGKEVLRFQSYHQGMGSFFLTPKKGESYKVEIYEPIGISNSFALPQTLSNAVGLRLDAQDKEKLAVSVFSHKAQSLCVLVQMRGEIVYEEGIEAKAGENALEISTQSLPVGIAQITVFDAEEIPQAERLTFVNKHRQLNISVQTHKSNYQIRDSVWLDILVRDELGKGVAGDFSLAVVDDKMWTFADDKQDNILSYLLMSSDLRGEVFEPNFYFNPKEGAKADTALDCVMLTHGWRRYNWRDLVAKNAAAGWKKQRQFEPEPATALAGTLSNNGQPMANMAIHISPLNAGDCYKGPKTIYSDEEGKFFIPYKSDCPLNLQSNYRGIVARYSFNNWSYPYIQPQPSRQPGVLFQPKPFKPSKINYQTGGVYANISNEKGAIKGRLFDPSSGEPIGFGIVKLTQKGILISAVSSDIDGLYAFNNIEPGLYNLEANYVGYEPFVAKNISVQANKVLIQDIALQDAAMQLQEVVVVQAERAQMDQRLTAMDMQRIPTRDVVTMSATTTLTTTVPGVTRAAQIDRLAELPRQDGRQQEVFNGAMLKTRGKKMGTVFGGEQDIIAIKPVVSKVSAMSENSNLLEMSRLKGEAVNMRSNDKIQAGAIGRGDGPAMQLSFQMSQAGAPAFYNARTFYAPDYTEYLQALKKGRAQGLLRDDFRNTIFWQPYLQTNAEGKARLFFFNSDASTTFRIVVEGVGQGGQVGRAEQTYSVLMPFEIDAKMPRILTFGDTVRMPVILKNTTENTIMGKLTVQMGPGLQFLLDSIPSVYELAANSVQVIELPFVAIEQPYLGKTILSFEANGISDQRTIEYELRSKGFPMELTISGRQASRLGSFETGDLVNGSLTAKMEVYANIFENLQSSMEGMLREPHGCFEQVSSSTYPNIMALQFMKATNSLKPDVYGRASNYIDAGYKKLAGYESAGGGFEWFGASPAHEGLTAFGLMEFKDMKEVYNNVNENMLIRARQWLLSRRDGKGGFQSKTGYNHGWGNSEKVANAYLVYALTYVGEKGLNAELNLATNEALESNDLYRLALVTLSNFNINNQIRAEELLSLLKQSIDKQGIENIYAEHSIMYSTGNALKVEILGLACMAILQSKNVDEGTLKKYINQLLASRSYGHFGNTQATVLALKALTAYAKYMSKDKEEAGTLSLYVNGEKAISQAVNSKNAANLVFDDLGKFFKAGKNDIDLRFEGMENAMPYSLRVNWATYTPNSDAACPLKIATKLAAKQSKVGETIRLSASISNQTKKDAPSAMALIGIPAGLSLQPWQLKELLDKQKADFYEIQDNYLVLYYRSIRAGETKIIDLDLKAEVPGVYRAAASHTYMYYSAEFKDWVEGETLRIEQ